MVGSSWGSPLWAHFRELELLPNQDFPKQIVGHTPKESIDISKNIIGIDTFHYILTKIININLLVTEIC